MQNPLSILPTRLLPWFARNARPLPWRQDRRPYHVWLSEIMLQQTRVEAVWNYYLRFLAALPTVEDLAAAEEDKLLKLWEGLGYYNRARNLQKCARVIVNDLHGEVPTDYDGWLALPGIGPYTAGAVASICFDCPVAAVDGNVLRVITRFTENAAPIDLQTTKARIKADLEQVYPAGACGTFTQALMELGACVCTPKSPKCSLCPLGDVCAANTSGSQTDFPVKLPKRAKRHQNRTVFFLTCRDRVALSKRGDKGLLSGLWQLPDTDDFLNEGSAIAYLQNVGLEPLELQKIVHANHVFTHIHWDMRCYYMTVREAAGRYTWVPLEEVRRDYALPTAYRQFFEVEDDH